MKNVKGESQEKRDFRYGYHDGYKDGLVRVLYAEGTYEKSIHYGMGYEAGYEDGIYMEIPDKEDDLGGYLKTMLSVAKHFRKPPAF